MNGGHLRQSSSASNSSAFSSCYSDELLTPRQRTAPAALLLHHSAASTSGARSAAIDDYETFQHDLNAYYQQHGVWIASGGGGGGGGDSGGDCASPPPPPPPVRDASSLRYGRYNSVGGGAAGSAHEKLASWPIGGGSGGAASPAHRSKSWTEQTDYVRAGSIGGGGGGGSRRSGSVPASAIIGYNHQLKTVPETLLATHESAAGVSPQQYLGAFDDCDPYGHHPAEQPERHHHHLHHQQHHHHQQVHDYGSASAGADYADLQLYSHSEGYSSYVPSESSYVSVSATPLLDQLRRDVLPASSASVAVAAFATPVRRSPLQHNGGGGGGGGGGRDSSNSNETLRLHGSYSDISSSSGGSRFDSGGGGLTAAGVAHSARVMAPQRHNSESVLYYAPPSADTSPAPAVALKFKSIRNSPRAAAAAPATWNQRLEHSNHWNCSGSDYALATPAQGGGGEQESAAAPPRSPPVDTTQPPSVAERIHQLERQSRSVPNLARTIDPACTAADAAAAGRTQLPPSHQRSRNNLCRVTPPQGMPPPLAAKYSNLKKNASILIY